MQKFVRRGGAVGLLCSVVLVFASGCVRRSPAGFRCELPAPVFVTLTAERTVNPSTTGEPLPTLVRLFQLTALTNAEGLEPRDFWESAQEKLGNELVAQEEVTVAPGETLTRWINRRGSTNYLVVVGLFRKLDGKAWRSTVVLPPVEEWECPTEAPPPREGNPKNDDVRVHVSLREYRVEAQRLGAKR